MPREIKEENKKKAQERIFVEHLIRVIKIFRVASERFRLHSSNYEKVILHPTEQIQSGTKVKIPP